MPHLHEDDDFWENRLEGLKASVLLTPARYRYEAVTLGGSINRSEKPRASRARGGVAQVNMV